MKASDPERIARAIEQQPVLGHWPHMRAADDAAIVRALAAELAEAKRVLIDRAVQQGNAEAERDALRAALKKYGEHSFPCASEYDQCSCGLSEALRGAERTADQPTASPNVALEAWARELHRQLEKIWYTPKGVAYSEDEQAKVCEVLGPTDNAVPAGFDRAAHWYKIHGRAVQTPAGPTK